MIKLLTDCNKCLHNGVCKNRNNAENAMKKLKNTNYGCGPNDDYEWDMMSEHLSIIISFSCQNYEEKIPTPKYHKRPYTFSDIMKGSGC